MPRGHRSAPALRGSLVLALMPVLGAAAAMDEALVQRRLGAMATTLEVRVWGEDRRSALRASEYAVRAVQAAEARLSTWRGDSELTRLNRTPVGEEMALSPELARALAAVQALWRASGGGFDPGVGSLVDAWGLRDGGRRPSAAELAAARDASGLEHLELRGRWARRRHAGLRLEEGGFAKGLALDDALAALRGAGIGRATVDLGGQVAALGGPHAIDLAHPAERARILLRLTLDDASAATAGNGVRSLEVAGQTIGHLLDPASGRPVPDWGSLTVLAPSALAADALATGLYPLGAEGAVRWALHENGLEAIAAVPAVVGAGVEVLAGSGLAGALEVIDPHVRVRFIDNADPAARAGPHRGGTHARSGRGGA